jgi:ArsR family transcriptional regulator
VNLLISSREIAMTVATTEDRLRRLVESGVRGSCRPSERLSELRKKARELDDLALSRLEHVFAGLADKTRLKILRLLADEELCACEVMAALHLTQPTASHHLGILERSGVVASRRGGKWVFFRPADPKVESLLSKGSQLAQGSL